MRRIVGQKAWDNHANGLNCAESTFKAVFDAISEAQMTNFPPEIVALATGFGGGVGSSGNTCGALLGAIMATGIIHGRKNPYAKESAEERRKELSGPQGLYRLFNNLVHEFAEINGSACCEELIKPYSYSSEERKLFCRTMVSKTAIHAIDWIFNGIEKGYSYPFHHNIMGKTD